MQAIANPRVMAYRVTAHRGLPHRVMDVGQSLHSGVSLTWYTVVAVIALHVVLAVAMRHVTMIGNLHAIAVLGLGIYFAAFRSDRRYATYCIAYICCSEVLWRMTRSAILWEYGKYAAVAICLTAIVRNRIRPPWPAILYLCFLIPSAFLTFGAVGWQAGREDVSFNMSGPLALMMCAWFFHDMRLSPRALKAVFLCTIGPAAGVVALALRRIASTPDLRFSDESNFAASGGFAPNQVSAALGLATVLCLLSANIDQRNRWVRYLFFALALVFAAQSALTFSRGGLYGAAGAMIMALPFLLKDHRAVASVMLGGLALVIIGAYVIFPAIDSFTGGALKRRFSDTSGTHRGEIMEGDLAVWREHVALGVGPGQAKKHRGPSVYVASAHTEFTRLLSEHGTLGLFSIVALLVLCAQRFVSTQGEQRAIMVALTAWSLLFMMNSGMRLAAPSIAFGLAGLSTSAPGFYARYTFLEPEDLQL